MAKRLTKKAQIVLCTLTALLLVLAVWTIWGNSALTVSTVVVTTDSVPAVFSGFRIAQVSDLHNAEFGENNARLLELLSESGRTSS